MKTKINLRELKLKRLRFKRLRYRTVIILTGIIATVILAFNFWFIDHAEEALEQIVYTQSKGKLKLKVGNFKFNWIKNNIELEKASIYSADTTAATSYAVNTDRITIKAKGFLPLLFRKEINIDSIRLSSPSVVFTRHTPRVKENKVKDSLEDNSFSVAEEMGRISSSITDAITLLKIDKFRLDNGSFSLVNKVNINEKPFAVSNIYIQLDNLQFDSTQAGQKGKERISFTDNIAIRTHDQNIIFPGGRHFISFKDFRVNLQTQRVEFDSCTLRAIKGDSSRTAFKIFFDKLQLTNINFDSLYSVETIIADSVFCSRPQIYFDIDADQKKGKITEKRTSTQRIDALMQQLLGDIRLNYVGVKQADIHVNTINKGKASTFSSRDNNFEMYKLLVRPDLEKPVSLQKFVMSLHHYENILGDGRYAISFDSIRFEDDVINLSKFSFKEFDKGHIVKSLSMPAFQVRGLSWESLLYDNLFSAQSAEFFNPTVDYRTTRKKKKGASRGLFGTLNSVDDVMDLKNLKIHNGNIILRFGKDASLSLSNTNLDLLANDFTSANRIRSVQRSVNALHFDKGVFKRGDLVAHLNQVTLSENKSGIKAGSLSLQSDNINANANSINLGTITLDSAKQSIVVEGIKWMQANVKINPSTPYSEKKKAAPSNRKTTSLVLRNINGSNTTLNAVLNQNKISGNFNTIALKELIKNAEGKPEIKGMSVDGSNFLLWRPNLSVSISDMDITDHNNSVFKNIKVQKIDEIDSIIAIIPKLTIIPNITEVVSGNFILQGLVITDPVVTAKLGRKDNLITTEKKSPPTINIGSAFFERPDIKLSIQGKGDSINYISWDGTKSNSYLKLTNLVSTSNIPLQADQIKMFLTNFEFINTKGKKTATNDNKLNLEFNGVLVKKDEQGQMAWKTDVNILSLDKLSFDSLGKNNAELKLDKGDVRNIALNSRYIKNIGDVIANSTKLNVNGTNGSFITGKNELFWHGFSVKDRIFSVDSLRYSPKQSVESYRVAKAFNEDYLRIHTGKVSGGPVDIEKYNKDSILSIDYIQLNDVDLFTFKDKTQPDTVIKYKPLPAEMLLNLKNSLDIDSIRLNNMHVTYWEVNPNTDSLGVIPVSDLNVLISNIKNYDIKETDSIYIVASANVLNNLYTTLNVSQSYFDTTGYMRMHLTTGSMDLTKFNSVLVPLVGAKVFNGHLEGLNLNAIGNNEAAIGTAHMHYKHLKIGLLNKNDLPNQTFLNKLVSRVAMAFVIRKNNKGIASTVFFERWQEKSPINYIIKTSLEGIKSSIGLPGAKKKLRKYQKRAASDKK